MKNLQNQISKMKKNGIYSKEEKKQISEALALEVGKAKRLKKINLNKRVRNLYFKFLNSQGDETEEFEVLTEWKKIYFLDENLEFLNIESVKALIKMNFNLRAIPLSMFGKKCEPFSILYQNGK